MSPLSDHEVAREIALDLLEGQYVNLGIGLPTLVAREIPAEKEVIIQSENGILGVGPPPAQGEEDWDLIDAGKNPVTLLPGGAYMSHADSFCLIRGSHLDVAVLGAFEVAMNGDLANWSSGDGVPGVGGAMDLAIGAKQIFVIARHLSRSGQHKLVTSLTLPVTGRAIVDRVYTDLGIFEPMNTGFLCRGLALGVSHDELQEVTGAPVRMAQECWQLPRSG